MKRGWLLTPIFLVVLAAVSYVVFIYFSPETLPEGFLYGNGHIEGTEVHVSAEVPGRVVESFLVEGEKIEKGSVLVRLDDLELQAQLKQAAAQITAIERERVGIEEELQTWRHHFSTAERDLKRTQRLKEEGSVSERTLDEAENAYEDARGRLRSLEEGVAQAAARLEVARQNLEVLNVRVAKTRVKAPIDGSVIVKAIEEGEYAAPGRVVAVLVNMSQLELKVYLPEAEIGKVKIGDSARVRIDAFPDRYFDARISRIDQRAQFTPKDIHMPEERTQMVFGVMLALNNDEGYLKPGMPADAWIRWLEETPWPNELSVPGS